MNSDIGALLASSPDVCGGRLRINGTRVTVNQIVVWYKQGYNPEEIKDQYPHLNLAQVYASLAYYHANKSLIETDLASEVEEAEALERQFSAVLEPA